MTGTTRTTATAGEILAKLPYFAFGSNLSSARLHFNCKTATFRSVALLKDYKLEFKFNSNRWKGSAANIIPEKGSHVYGILWDIDSPEVLEALDRQEGVAHGIYQRTNLTVYVHDKPIPCFGYELTQDIRNKSISEDGHNQIPSKVYKDVIIRGAKEHKLPQEYIEVLESLPSNDYDGPVDLTNKD